MPHATTFWTTQWWAQVTSASARNASDGFGAARLADGPRASRLHPNPLPVVRTEHVAGKAPVAARGANPSMWRRIAQPRIKKRNQTAGLHLHVGRRHQRCSPDSLPALTCPKSERRAPPPLRFSIHPSIRAVRRVGPVPSDPTGARSIF